MPSQQSLQQQPERKGTIYNVNYVIHKWEGDEEEERRKEERKTERERSRVKLTLGSGLNKKPIANMTNSTRNEAIILTN